MPALMRAARSLAPISRSKSRERALRLGAASPADAAVSSGSRLIRGLQRRSLLRRSTLGSIQRFGEVIRHNRQAGVFGILDHRRQGAGDGLGNDGRIARRLLVGIAPRPRNRALVDMGTAHRPATAPPAATPASRCRPADQGASCRNPAWHRSGRRGRRDGQARGPNRRGRSDRARPPL